MLSMTKGHYVVLDKEGIFVVDLLRIAVKPDVLTNG